MFSEWNVLIFELAPFDILRILEQAILQKNDRKGWWGVTDRGEAGGGEKSSKQKI